MQVGVIGGVCLLACLLSVGQTEELGESKQSEESETSDQKDVERLAEDDVRRLNYLKNSKEALGEPKTDVNSTEQNSLEGGSKLNAQIRNASLSEDGSASKENINNSSAQFKASPESIPPKSSSYFIDSHFTIEQGPVGQQAPGAGSSNGPQTNPYFNSIPYMHPNFMGGPGQSSPPSLSSPPVQSVPSNTNVRNTAASQDSVLRSEFISPNKTAEANPRQELNSLAPQYNMNTTKPIERTLALNTNKFPYGQGVMTPEQGSRFSPLFSSEYAHRPSSEFIDPPYPVNKNLKEYPPFKPQSYSYDSKAAFDETRRESKKDDIQVRNVDENQYSETMNSYPYTPLSSGSDSSSRESGELRSGAPNALNYPPYPSTGLDTAQAYATAQVQTIDGLSAHNQGLNPYSFGYPPRPVSNIESFASASATAQLTPSGTTSTIGSVGAIDVSDAKSRLIWPYEYIFPHKMPGGENVIQCSRENELHHFWSKTFDCLVCICLNEYGLLEPVCASCSGCRTPTPSEPPPNMPEPIPPSPEPYVPLPIPDSYVPIPVSSFEPFTPSASAPSLVAEPGIELDLEPTTLPSIREAPVSCSPLPNGPPFKHPLNPCQMCMCKEFINALGKADVRIECQDSSQCVLPPETTTLPPIPDAPIPVPLPLCEKFPPHVLFPHPKEQCKQCKCSVEPSEAGVLEQQITCFHDTTDVTCVVPKLEPTTELVTPPAPPIPIPVEPYPGPFPEPVVEPIPEHFPPSPSPPNSVTPSEPLPWPPISTPAPPLKPLLPRKGPLPGPSPHESCRPYPPNQPFQHPWDDCQICECSETKAIGMINVEISCYTKLSCCIESPEHVVSAIAGKSNSKAAGGPHGEDSQALALVIEPSSSTFKPFSPAIRQNQGYVEPNALSSSSVNSPIYQSSMPYQPLNGIGTSSAETSIEYKPQASYMPGLPQNQGYAEVNAVAQSTLNKPAYLVPGSYQTANVFGSVVNGGSQSSAEANIDYTIASAGTNNPSQSFGTFTPGISQNQAYAEANALAPKPVSNPSYQMPGPYQSAVQAISSVSNGGLSSETSDEYIPLSVTYKPSLLYPQYNPAISQTYAEANAQYNRPVSTTYKPPTLYGQYNPEVAPNQAYAEALVQYNELMANTQKPPALYGQYTPGISQNQGLAQANVQYNNFITSTFKPPALYNPYNQDALQTQAYAQANAQYGNLMTSTPRPTTLYGQYPSAVSQNQVYPSPNAVYSGSLTGTEKPVPSFNPYSTGVVQNQAYAGASAQNSLASPGYYLSAPYQSAKATGSVSGGDQSSAVAEAVAQSQDYSPYIQSVSQLGTNAASNPSSVYPYPSNYYAGYLNPQYTTYPGRTDKGLDGFKQSPIKYAGNYEFNGQADSISVLNPQSSYYPYGSGYTQSIPASNMYSSLYPKQTSYEISPAYRPGQYSVSNAQSVAQSYGVTKMQTKSGYPEDSEDSK